jgi:signal transduction histidine kinase
VSPRTARVITRGILVVAVLMVAATFMVTRLSSRSAVTTPIVVPQTLTSRIEQAVAVLRDDPNAETDPALADAPSVFLDIEEQIANGATHVGTGVNAPNVLGSVIALLWIATGSLIVSRQPRNLAGWLFAAVGIGWILEALGMALVAWSLLSDRALPVRGLFAVMGDSSLAAVLLLPLLFLLYPDGRVPSRRWRWVEWLVFVGLGVWLFGYTLSPGPLNNFVDSGILYMSPIGVSGLGGVAGPLAGIGGVAVVLAALATVPAVRGRYKRSTGEERQQLRWLVAVATLAGTILALIVAAIVLLPDGGDEVGVTADLFTILLVGFVLIVSLGVPAAYLIAIYRHGLWDLDVVIRKARVALGITFLIVIPVLLFLALLSQVLIWDWAPKPLTLVGGVVLGTLLIPLFRLARRTAARITYGKRATPYEVLSHFSDRVGETYSADDVLARMAQVLASGTGATQARVLLKIGGELQEAAAHGEPGGREHLTPVRFQGDELGALAVTMAASDPMDASKERLVRDLAAQAGPVLHNVRLIEELRASRKRLVSAQDEERRKLERNIHDGLQQQLVALAVRLKLADATIDTDPAKTHESLRALQADAGTALEELRDLARGIYPPLLADKGLAAALEAQARKAAVPTGVSTDDTGRYPQEIEAAVYFCTLEALNNVAKYAQASRAEISLAQRDGRLTFTVADDGIGFDADAKAYGTGMQGMRDRLDAIGGTLAVKSEPGHGTTITGTVPVRSA